MGFVVALFGLVVILAVVGVVVAGVVAMRNGANFKKDSQLIPGVPTSAPAAWAGSHDPEAKLHRRLRDALAALAANQAFDDDGALLDLRVSLQQEAMALDEQLVATAALPVHLRKEPLEQITAATAAIEQAVADLAGSSVADATTRLDTVLDDVRARTGLVAQARAALDALGPVPDAEATTAPAPPGVAPAPPATSPSAEPPPGT